MSKSKKSPSRICIGTKFRYHHADGQPMWKVTKVLRRGVYQCEVLEDEPDWAGVERIFAREEIQRALSIQSMWDEVEDAHEAFYGSLEQGQIVHYHHGFGEFVRCQVTRATEDGWMFLKGQTCLHAFALVGPWHDADLLPDAYRRGTLGKLMRPNASNIYENPKATSTHEWPDPSKEDPRVAVAIEGASASA
jgi:hypothetical protein